MCTGQICESNLKNELLGLPFKYDRFVFYQHLIFKIVMFSQRILNCQNFNDYFQYSLCFC